VLAGLLALCAPVAGGPFEVVDRTKLTPQQNDALTELYGQLAQLRQVKLRMLGHD